MALSILTALDLGTNQLLNIKLQNLASDPGANESGVYYNTTAKEVRYHNGTAWIALGPAGAGGPPTGAASGDLTGSYPGPTIANAKVVAAYINANLVASGETGTGVTGTAVSTFPALRALGTGANQALAGTTRLDQIAAPTASVNLNSRLITNLLDPASAQDAATKNYVDNTAAGLSWKDSVRVATTTNGTLSSAFQSGATIDGVTLASGNRILIKNQTTTTENGIYVVTGGAPTRATDADSGTEIEQAAVFVSEGTTQADTAWVLSTNAPITIGSTGLTFAQFGAGAVYTGGAGIAQSGNTLSIVSTTADMTVGADDLTIVSAPKWTTGRTIALTGDVTGTSAAFDGSGNLSFATTVAATVPKKFAVDVGAGTSFVVNHALGTRDVCVEVYRNTTPWDTVMCDVERTDTNNVTLRFASSVTAAQYRCVVVGR